MAGDGTPGYFNSRNVTFVPLVVVGGGSGGGGGRASKVPGAANTTPLALLGTGAQDRKSVV